MVSKGILRLSLSLSKKAVVCVGSKLGDMNREVLPGQRVSQSPEGRRQVECAAGRVGWGASV